MITFSLLCIGSLLMGAAVLVFVWNLLFVLRSETADGKIVAESNNIDEHNSGSHAIVQFKTRDGQIVEFQDKAFFGFFLSLISDFYSAQILKKDPSKVMVAYDPNNPKKARIKDVLYLYNTPFLLSFIGIVVIIFGFLPAGLGAKVLDFIEKIPF